jgi:hypothetical protein
MSEKLRIHIVHKLYEWDMEFLQYMQHRLFHSDMQLLRF